MKIWRIFRGDPRRDEKIAEVDERGLPILSREFVMSLYPDKGNIYDDVQSQLSQDEKQKPQHSVCPYCGNHLKQKEAVREVKTKKQEYSTMTEGSMKKGGLHGAPTIPRPENYNPPPQIPQRDRQKPKQKEILVYLVSEFGYKPNWHEMALEILKVETNFTEREIHVCTTHNCTDISARDAMMLEDRMMREIDYAIFWLDPKEEDYRASYRRLREWVSEYPHKVLIGYIPDSIEPLPYCKNFIPQYDSLPLLIREMISNINQVK